MRIAALVVIGALVVALGAWALVGRDSPVTPVQQACAEQLHDKFPQNPIEDWIETCQETHPS